MDKKYLNSIGELDLAGLSNAEESKLRAMEEQFNNEFGTDYYFIVMKKEAALNF